MSTQNLTVKFVEMAKDVKQRLRPLDLAAVSNYLSVLERRLGDVNKAIGSLSDIMIKARLNPASPEDWKKIGIEGGPEALRAYYGSSPAERSEVAAPSITALA